MRNPCTCSGFSLLWQTLSNVRPHAQVVADATRGSARSIDRCCFLLLLARASDHERQHIHIHTMRREVPVERVLFALLLGVSLLLLSVAMLRSDMGEWRCSR